MLSPLILYQGRNMNIAFDYNAVDLPITERIQIGGMSLI